MGHIDHILTDNLNKFLLVFRNLFAYVINHALNVIFLPGAGNAGNNEHIDLRMRAAVQLGQKAAFRQQVDLGLTGSIKYGPLPACIAS
jgi:hypothetical protein